MTVGDLIDRLSKVDPDHSAMVHDASGQEYMRDIAYVGRDTDGDAIIMTADVVPEIEEVL